MNKKLLSISGSVILAIGTGMYLQNSNSQEQQDKVLLTSFVQDDKEQVPLVKQSKKSAKSTSPVTSKRDNKKISDVYQNFRKQDIVLEDAKQANAFLNEMYIPSHITDENFVFIEAKYGTDGSTYYNFQQTYKGLEVYGSEVAVQVSSQHKLESIIGKYSTALTLNTTAKVQATVALDSTLNTLSNGDQNQQKVYQAPELVVYMDYNDMAHLAYESIIKYSDPSGKQHIEKVFIDANNAELIDSIDRIHTERDIDIYSVNGQCVGRGANLPGNLVRENDTAVGTASVDNAYDYLNDAYYFYKHMFNRFSYDANDATVTATVDATFSNGGSCSGLNAFFSPDDKQLAFGTGDNSTKNFAGAADIVGHELTHAVTWKTSNLEYKNESGALNESISDIFGVTIQTWTNAGGGVDGNPTTLETNSNTWLLGEQLENTSFLRYLNDPTKDNRSPDNYSDRKTGSDDNGGVHSNSGITNLSYALLVEGGTHPQNETSVEVTGIGMDKAIRIWYEAQTTTISTRTDFDNIRASLANAATSLYEECSPEYKAVQLSMDAVKMPGTWECAEPDTTAPTIISISPLDGSTDLAINTVAKVTFNEPMSADSINTSNIMLSDASGSTLIGTLNTSGETVSFIPENDLAYESTYTFTVTTGLTDSAGNNLENESKVSFNTGVKPDDSDKIAPTISSISPNNNTIDLAKDTSINVTFSEAIDADSLKTAFTLKTQAGENVTGSLNVTGSTASFTPSELLNAETTYLVSISTEVKDLAGNRLESIKNWSFTTEADPVIPDDSTVSLEDATLRASSQYNYSYSVNNIRDGKLLTEWVSKTNYRGFYQSEWIQVDLNKNSNVNTFSITWNGYYFPKEMQLWAVINGSWEQLQSIQKYSAGVTTFTINKNVKSIHLAMRGGRYGSWFVIKEINLD